MIVYLLKGPRLLVLYHSGWTTESLLNWSQFFKLAVSGMFMTCVEIWSFQSGAFLTGNRGATGSPLTRYMRSCSCVTYTFCVVSEYLLTWFTKI